MSLLPDTASFHERVQALFVSYRARGVALSAVDVELVEEWASANIPFEIVARGIRKSAELALWDAAADDRGLRSLTACRAQVKREIKKYLTRAAGQTREPPLPAAPFHVARHRKLKAALKRLGTQRPALAAPLAQFVKRLAVPHDFAAANAQEELALATLLRLLPFTDRIRLLREARRLVQNGAAVSAPARLESLRFHRAALVRHELELPGFW